MEDTKKVFRSRISVLILVLVLVPLTISTITAFIHHAYPTVFIVGGTLLFVVVIFTGMRYEISESKLYLRMWFIPTGSKNITDIISVARTYNPLSSPAASLKRLEIRFRTGGMHWLISPVREKEFIESLKAIHPTIQVNIPEKKGICRFWDWDI